MYRLLLYLAAASCVIASNSTVEPEVGCDNRVSGCRGQKTEVPTGTSGTTAAPRTSGKGASSTTTTTTTPRTIPLLGTPQAGELITRTTDAIYKALSSVFSYDDDYPAEASTEVNILRQTTTTVPTPTLGTTRAAAEVTTASTTTSTTTSTTRTPTTSHAPAKHHEASHKSKHHHHEHQNHSSSTTRAPKSHKTTGATGTALKEPIKPTGATSNDDSMSSTLLGILNSAIKSVYSMNFLNRTARLAPEHDLSDFSVESGKLMLAGEQVQPATSDDVHLLCKLLHKHFENQTKAAAIATTPPTTTSTTTTTTTTTLPTTSTTKSPKTSRAPNRLDGSSTREPQVKPSGAEGLTVASTRELSETHKDHLLESTLQYDAAKIAEDTVALKQAKELVLGLFNAAVRLREAGNELPTPSSDYEADEEAHMLVGNKESRFRELLLHSWNQSSSVYTPGKVRLVYWLLEPPEAHHTSQHHHHRKGARLRVLDSREALDLLSRLDQSQVQRQLRGAGFSSPTALAEAYRGGQLEQEPNVIDDSLISVPESAKQSSSAFRLLLDKLSHSSFMDNLHLYLVIFMVALLLIILCIACPLFCCKAAGSRQEDESPRRNRNLSSHAKGINTDSTISTISGDYKGSRQGRLSRSNGRRQAGETEDVDPYDCDERKHVDDSIWRKLSNTTTTLKRDVSQVARTECASPVARDSTDSPDGNEAAKSGKFEWYSFEDRLEEQETHRSKTTADQQSQTYIISDRRQITKSVQTNPLTQQAAERRALRAGGAQLGLADQQQPKGPLMDFKERQEKRNSDTLTKSELVMIKEKLVPIAQPAAHHTRQVASQTTIDKPDPIYVNQSSQRDEVVQSLPEQSRVQPELSEQVSRYIDSSISRSDSNGQLMSGQTGENIGSERRPKIRLLDLPVRTQSRVEAIKAELGKLEQRDASTSSMPRSRHQSLADDSTPTYRRYDL